jgi:hypothetical protein
MFGVEPFKSCPPSMGVRLGPLGNRKSGAYVEPVSLDPAFRDSSDPGSSDYAGRDLA